jgi:polyhydroxyalkanoate synthesis regulator phasin
MESVFHRFFVSDKKDISPQEAFKVAQDIVNDASSTSPELWPKRSQLALEDITKKDGVRTYHFKVVEL